MNRGGGGVGFIRIWGLGLLAWTTGPGIRAKAIGLGLEALTLLRGMAVDRKTGNQFGVTRLRLLTCELATV